MERLPEIIRNAFGIDFGTTCSATAGLTIIEGNDAQPVHYGDTRGNPIKSAVAIHRETGESIIGQKAWDAKMEFDEEYELIPSIKRQIGTDWTLELPTRTLYPVDIAEMLFSELKAITEHRTGLEMTEAVVAIPIGFSGRARRELREAAERAGLHISSFISEPTASFFAHYSHLQHDHNVAVFDWGGGTLDVSILRHKNGCIEELATCGMDKAGNDIDELLARKIHAMICDDRGTSLPFEAVDNESRLRLLRRCEQAKRKLSNPDSTRAVVSVNRYGDMGVVRQTIDYDWFRDIISPFVKGAYNCFSKAVQQANLNERQLDRVLLTGGSSNLRPLHEYLSRFLGDMLEVPDETAWNVADGAAKLCMFPGDYYSSQRIDLVLSDGEAFPILKEGEQLKGWHSTDSFGLVDKSGFARIVFAGSDDIMEEPARRRSVPFPSYNFDTEDIILETEVDDDLIFRVTVRSNMRSSKRQSVWEYARLKTTYRLPPQLEKND